MSEEPSKDGERRGAKSRPGARDHGQFVGSSSFHGHTLPEGTLIGGLEITGLIGEGGFGIVYLAYDSGLQRELAVKEYMPSSLAARAPGSHDVVVKSERHAETFAAGLRSFVNEARLLARFDHPSLLKVYRFWEANGTAYMAMPYYEGWTLKRSLMEMGHPPDEETLRGWLAPLLDALAVMHDASCFHRDIAPDNILLTPHGPLLLDFGAARRVIGDMTHALTVVLKPGFAPIEQYGDSPAMSQGAWTDLYALACVVYYAITGKTPMSSVERMMSDTLVPLSQRAAERYSAPFIQAIDAALAVRPTDRPQSVAQFRAIMDAGRAPAPVRVRALVPLPIITSVDLGLPTVAPQATAPDVLATVIDDDRTVIEPERTPAATLQTPPLVPPSVAAAASPRSRRRLYAIGSAIGLAAIAGAAIVLVPRTTTPPVAPPTAPVAEPTPAPAPAAVVDALPAAPAASVPPPLAATPAAVETNDGTPPAAAASAPPTALTEAPPPAAAPRPKRSAAAMPTVQAKQRCSDILQKASLEPLTPDEAAFLRRECR